jgi:hypothetical protein
MTDNSTYNADRLARLERELAAVVRQYGRAADAGDGAAQEIEAEAISDRIRRLLYHHLDLRVGMSSENWIWLDGLEGGCRVERSGPVEMRACGRILCTLSEEGRWQWTEPFSADISHSAVADELCGYTVWFGSRATMLDLPAVGRLIKSGEVVAPPAPSRKGAWAFLFRMGDRA